MVYLDALGILEEDLKSMVELNNELFNLSDKDICDKINILKSVNCDDKIIRNIIVSNPQYLSRYNEDILELIVKLKSLGLKNLDITFDSNPWLLNYDAFEIDDFIQNKKTEGLKLDEIVDLIDSGMVN